MTRFFDHLPAVEASRRVGFAGNLIERRSEHRDAAIVAAALSDPAAQFYLFRGDKVLRKSPPEPLFGAAEAARLGAAGGEPILLGWREDVPRIAALVPEAAPVAPTVLTSDLRSLASEGALAAEHDGALAQARSLMNWHARHGFCSMCGARSVMALGGYRRDCPNCGAQHFPRTDPVVIMIAIRGAGADERVLLGRQKQFLPGMYSALAGFMEPGETIEDAVRRETLEEAGVAIGRVAYHASQPWPFPMSLMIGCHAEALSDEIRPDETELEDCRWFGRDEVRAMLAGTHPDGLRAPAPIAIANRLLTAWAEEDTSEARGSDDP
ncbi:MAG TPA: NAD(+) diphosphatase [Bauldia sp.]|nr:NAD(+) diphosphatase [Bauldia sp.]